MVRRRPNPVDPGAYAYTGPDRNRFRGTAAHNTVELDGVDQCEFWGDFRLAFPPQVRAQRPKRIGKVTMLRASHSGYTRLPRPATHERVVLWWTGRGVVIIDRLLGEGTHEARSRLHLAPGLAPQAGDRVGPVRIRPLTGASQVDRGLYSPYLGISEEITVLLQTMDVSSPNVVRLEHSSRRRQGVAGRRINRAL